MCVGISVGINRNGSIPIDWHWLNPAPSFAEHQRWLAHPPPLPRPSRSGPRLGSWAAALARARGGLRSRAGPLFLVKGPRDQGSRARPQEAKAEVDVAVGRIDPIPTRNTRAEGTVAPGTAPPPPAVAKCSPNWISTWTAAVVAAAVPILGPLPDIPTHVVQATGVRCLGGYRVSGAA
jgi:hypothetical protein